MLGFALRVAPLPLRALAPEPSNPSLRDQAKTAPKIRHLKHPITTRVGQGTGSSEIALGGAGAGEAEPRPGLFCLKLTHDRNKHPAAPRKTKSFRGLPCGEREGARGRERPSLFH